MSDYPAYDAVLKAIQDSGTAVDDKYKAIGDASTTLCDVNQTVSQIPDASIVRNRDGDVIGYDYKYTSPQLPNPSIMEVDSNTDNGWYATGGGGQTGGGGAGRYRASTYAGQVVNNPQSTDKMTGGGLVSSNISASWAITSVLAKLGKKVAEVTADTLEAADLHFGLQFGPLCVDSGYGTGDAANAIRALFGVDSQGNTTMYLDEDVIGAAAIVAKDDGFFNQGPSALTPTAETVQHFGEVYNLTFYPNFHYIYGTFTYRNETATGYFCYALEGTFLGRQVAHGYVLSSLPDNEHYQFVPVGPPYYQTLACIDDVGDDISFRLHGWFYLDDHTAAHAWAWNYSLRRGASYTYLNRTAWAWAAMGLHPNEVTVTQISTNYGTAEDFGIMAWEIMYGCTPSTPSIPGVSDQTGATIPVDAITGADPHVVAQNLESQYPSVMGTPIQVVVMDDSCNEVTKNYYAVPISYSPTNLNINAPITGGLQVSPSFNPDVTLDLPDIDFDNYIDQIIKILGGSGAGRDVTTEPEPEDPSTPSKDIDGGPLPAEVPDTGTGTTPTVVPPTTDVTSMWHVYSPFDSALSALGSWLWSASIIDQIVRLFTNPMEAIMGVHAIYAAPDISSQEPIVVGNLTSTASAAVVTSQYKALDCGSVWMTEYFGNIFDYEPYTKISLYLPFIGIVPLSVADVMRAKISVSYVIDFYTGACVAKVSVERDGVGGVLYEFPGDCSVKYPVSGASYTGLVQSIVASAMSALRVGMATGGAPGTAALGAAAAGATFVGSGQKVSISHSGAFSGNHGAMGSKIPYLIISRPITEMADNFELFDGLPANKQVRLDSCSGYTKCKEVHVVSTGAYKSELDEIERLLRSGVIL